jgi:hypothetical protein
MVFLSRSKVNYDLPLLTKHERESTELKFDHLRLINLCDYSQLLSVFTAFQSKLAIKQL